MSSLPAHVDPESLLDLVSDCREVTGVLAAYLSPVTPLPAPRPVPAAEIAPGAAAWLAGYAEYGA